jgi:hypothetical protein
MRLNYRIETSRIAPFAYKTPLVEINSDGELIVKESRKKSLKTFKSITFLNLVGGMSQEHYRLISPLITLIGF